MIRLFKLVVWIFLLTGPISLFMSDLEFGGGITRYQYFSAWCFMILTFAMLRISTELENGRIKNILAFLIIPILWPVACATGATILDNLFNLYGISTPTWSQNFPATGKIVAVSSYCFAGVVLVALFSLIPQEKYITMHGMGRGDRRYKNRDDFYTLGKKIRDLSIKVLTSAAILTVTLLALQAMYSKAD